MIASRVFVALIAVASGVALVAETPALALRASVIGAPTAQALTIELLRWSTDAERAPLLTAIAPPPAPAAAAPPAAAAGEQAGRAAAAGRGGARGGGRGGARGGGAATPPASPAVRLSAAVKAAPTVGFIWGDGPTGYSIKYAWRAPMPDGRERIVLVTERRLGSDGAPGEAEYTVIEMRVDGKGAGEGKSSQAAGVIVDADAKTLALDGYAAAPALLKVTR